MEEAKNKIKKHIVTHQLEFFLFDLLVMFLVLIHSLHYFDPYFEITANIVIIVSIILSVIILGVRSRGVFLLSAFFTLASLFFKLLKIEVWSDRVAIYIYEAFFIAVVVFFGETIGPNVGTFLNKLKRTFL